MSKRKRTSLDDLFQEMYVEKPLEAELSGIRIGAKKHKRMSRQEEDKLVKEMEALIKNPTKMSQSPRLSTSKVILKPETKFAQMFSGMKVSPRKSKPKSPKSKSKSPKSKSPKSSKSSSSPRDIVKYSPQNLQLAINKYMSSRNKNLKIKIIAGNTVHVLEKTSKPNEWLYSVYKGQNIEYAKYVIPMGFSPDFKLGGSPRTAEIYLIDEKKGKEIRFMY